MLCIVQYGFLNIYIRVYICFVWIDLFIYLLFFLYFSSFPYIRALPDGLIHAALLILDVYIDIQNPKTVSWFINVAAGEKERVILNI